MLLYAILAILPAIVASDRDEKITASDKFVRPEECLEWCQAAASGIKGVLGVFGVRSSERYKCILRDRHIKPRGCDDELAKAKKRKYTKGQDKVTCPFNETQVAANLKDQLPKKCSDYMECCCTGNKRSLKTVCVPGISEELPKFSYDEKRQVFLRHLKQEYDNTGKCVGAVKALPYHVSGKAAYEDQSNFNDQGKCCIQVNELKGDEVRVSTKKGKKARRKRTGGAGYIGGGGGGGRPKAIMQKVDWTRCERFQKLYHCSDAEDKTTQTGQYYQTVAKGSCLGSSTIQYPDQSTPKVEETYTYATGQRQQVCPAGQFSNDKLCHCGVNCGSIVGGR